MSQCLGRRTFSTKRFHFGDGKHWVYAECQCKSKATVKELCARCNDRVGKIHLQSQPDFNHGTIGKDIPEYSQIYGGDWYKKGVEKWGEPSETDLKYLEQYSEAVMKSLKDYYKVNKSLEEIEEKMENMFVQADTKAEEKPVKKARGKAVTVTVEVSKIVPVIVAMELDDEPVIPEETIEIKLVVKTIDKKDYYYEPIKEKVYNKGSSNAIGEYIGRLKDGEIIKGIVDSDQD